MEEKKKSWGRRRGREEEIMEKRGEEDNGEGFVCEYKGKWNKNVNRKKREGKKNREKTKQDRKRVM